jgi:hypothetical protein
MMAMGGRRHLGGDAGFDHHVNDLIDILVGLRRLLDETLRRTRSDLDARLLQGAAETTCWRSLALRRESPRPAPWRVEPNDSCAASVPAST